MASSNYVVRTNIYDRKEKKNELKMVIFRIFVLLVFRRRKNNIDRTVATIHDAYFMVNKSIQCKLMLIYL